MSLPDERDVPQFTSEATWQDVVISYELSEPQKIQVKKLLQEYDMHIEHKNGRDHCNVDALSRV